MRTAEKLKNHIDGRAPDDDGAGGKDGKGKEGATEPPALDDARALDDRRQRAAARLAKTLLDQHA